MALPLFRDDGWFPKGHHSASWDEVILRLSGLPNSRCADIMASLLRWRDAAHTENLTGLIVLNGSFVSSKETPNDIDLVFSYDAATETLIRSKATARALTDYQVCRTLGFLGDIFALPASLGLSSPAFSGLDMFDFDRQGTPKGVIEVQR